MHNLIEDFNYLDFEYKHLGYSVTCQPSCITSVKFLNGKLKKIDHYHGNLDYDGSLTEFEDSIDGIIGTEKYINPPFED